MTKDEALKMAIEWVEGWKGIAPSKIELLRVLKEALEQPVKSITEGATMFKQIGNSPKPPSPLPPMHTCIYSRTMNQEYPRKCIQCGKVEAIGPAQEPMAWMNDEGFGLYPTNDSALPLYTHFAPAWQGLSDEELSELFAKCGWVEEGDNLHTLGFYKHARMLEQALRNKNDYSN